jgi:hypothetical protein
MPSTYTTNGGIELPANGEQSGTWGETINDNMSIIDRLTNGVGSISLSGTTHTLTTTDGTLSDGQYNVLVLGGSPSGTNTITISPNDGEHVYIVKNISGQTATFTQGSGASISVLNNTTKIIYADGAGAGAAVVDITGALDLGSLIIAGTSVTATAAELNFVDGVTSNVQTQLNTKAPLASPTFTGTVTANGGAVFNESGADVDFRVESDTDANALFVQGSDGFVGIGTSSPENPLHISNNSATSQMLVQGDTNDASIKFNKSGQSFVVGIDATDDSFRIADNPTLGTNDRLVINSSGNVGIGTSSPTHKLTVGGYSNVDAANKLAIGDNADYQALIYMESANETLTIENTSDYAGRATIFKDNGTERMRIDASGNVGIGTSSPTGLLNVKSTYVSDATTQTRLEDNTGCSLDFGSTASGHKWINSRDTAAGTAVPMIFQTGGSEVMRIATDNRVYITCTAAPSATVAGVRLGNPNDALCAFSSGAVTVETYQLGFYNGNGLVGRISTDGSATSYTTSSDYRLKQDWQLMSGASERVLALKPVNFEWISSGDRVDGFLAHEVQGVVPEAVSGTKDAMMDEEYEVTAAVEATYDEDGNELTAAVEAVMGTRSVPDYQGMTKANLCHC